MATIKPFAALRPKSDLAARICELPYDVMSSDEARQLAAGNPFSFLRVSKPEIDLPSSTDPYDPRVYATGRSNFSRFISEGWLVQDSKAAFYLYRQVMGDHTQLGLVAAADSEEYLRNLIRKHELTRIDKEDDRVRHIESLNSQTGPIFLVHRAQAAVDALFASRITQPPDIDFTAKDEVRHTAWVVNHPDHIKFIQESYAQIPYLYIADGHHRSAAAARVYQSRKGAGNSRYFLTVIFPDNQIQILPYNRVLKNLNGMTAATLLEKLSAIFLITKGEATQPARQHQLGLFLEGRWHTLHFRPKFAATADPVERLDVTLLQKFVLAPLFGIDDPRTSKQINFVGGIRGIGELEKLVNGGDYACAFSLFPTRIEDLMTIADAGGLMPPKSTWFEPKLRDGMFCHLI